MAETRASNEMLRKLQARRLLPEAWHRLTPESSGKKPSRTSLTDRAHTVTSTVHRVTATSERASRDKRIQGGPSTPACLLHRAPSGLRPLWEKTGEWSTWLLSHNCPRLPDCT